MDLSMDQVVISSHFHFAVPTFLQGEVLSYGSSRIALGLQLAALSAVSLSQ